MFKKFAQVTAIFSFPIAIMIPELISPKPSPFIITLVLASFLMCIGAARLWAFADLPIRAPIIVWNGLVRFFGFLVVTYAAVLGMAPPAFIPISLMDLVVAVIYILGSSRKTKIPIVSLICDKTTSQPL